MKFHQYSKESRPLEYIDEVVNKWSRIAVPLFVNDPESKHRAKGFGSGFVVERNSMIFLVTALHVIDGLKDNYTVVANIAGNAVLLNGLPFFTSKEDDLAVTLIEPSWAKNKGINSIFPLKLCSHEAGWNSLEVYVLLGYPGARNKLNWNTNKTTRSLVAYSSSQLIELPKSSNHIRTPIAFAFDKKEAVNTEETIINVGSFSGNSGGPVLEIFSRKKVAGAWALTVSLAGVFIGWDKQHKEIICCRTEALSKLIDEFINTILPARS